MQYVYILSISIQAWSIPEYVTAIFSQQWKPESNSNVFNCNGIDCCNWFIAFFSRFVHSECDRVCFLGTESRNIYGALKSSEYDWFFSDDDIEMIEKAGLEQQNNNNGNNSRSNSTDFRKIQLFWSRIFMATLPHWKSFIIWPLLKCLNWFFPNNNRFNGENPLGERESTLSGTHAHTCARIFTASAVRLLRNFHLWRSKAQTIGSVSSILIGRKSSIHSQTYQNVCRCFHIPFDRYEYCTCNFDWPKCTQLHANLFSSEPWFWPFKVCWKLFYGDYDAYGVLRASVIP